MAKEEKKKTAQDAWLEFAKLCRLLFGLGEKSPYNINEIKEGDDFYEQAREIAEELEIEWDSMSHDESNRLMLAMLDDYYNAIQIDKKAGYVIKVLVEEKKKNGVE